MRELTDCLWTERRAPPFGPCSKDDTLVVVPSFFSFVINNWNLGAVSTADRVVLYVRILFLSERAEGTRGSGSDAAIAHLRTGAFGTTQFLCMAPIASSTTPNVSIHFNGSRIIATAAAARIRATKICWLTGLSLFENNSVTEQTTILKDGTTASAMNPTVFRRNVSINLFLDTQLKQLESRRRIISPTLSAFRLPKTRRPSVNLRG